LEWSSLPVLAIQDGCTNPGCSFFVQSGPGQIKGLTVLGTGAGGQEVVNNFSGMDNAYATPNGTNSAPYWSPSAATYQGTQGTVNNNGARFRLQFVVQVQNVTNNANYTGYSGVLTSPFFGQPTSVLNTRKVDMGVNLSF